MRKPRLRLLLVEDDPNDALLLRRELEREYEVVERRVQNADEMREALRSEDGWDVVISDFSLPTFDGMRALEVLRESGHDLPFLVVSGTLDEDTAVTVLKAGAHDFLTKENLARLLPAIERERRDAQTRRDRKKAVDARDVFIANASHELRTPITALVLQITAALQIARAASSDSLPTQLRAKLEDARIQLDRLTALVNGLLDAASGPR